MNKIDDLIGKALTEEDRALLASHAEPGYMTQAFGIFRGPMAGVMWIMNIASGVAFIAGVYAIWQLFAATDAIIAMRWGVAALFLFQVTTLCKTLMGTRVEANRTLREIKRLELQLALLRESK
jgi:hypothetical protein